VTCNKPLKAGNRYLVKNPTFETPDSGAITMRAADTKKLFANSRGCTLANSFARLSSAVGRAVRLMTRRQK
jgi:hypothetical protein